MDSAVSQTRVCAYEIVVVDNNSTDGSQQMLTEEFPDVIGILNRDSRGFAAANNQGPAFGSRRRSMSCWTC